MDYSFDAVKNLFDTYKLVLNEKKEFIAVNRVNNIPYEGKSFVDQVKFAHTWVAAVRATRPQTMPCSNVVSQADYGLAFGESARELYDFVMELVSQTMQGCGRLLRYEALAKEVREASLAIAHADSIVAGLYENERFIQAFDSWVRSATMTPPGEDLQGKIIHR